MQRSLFIFLAILMTIANPASAEEPFTRSELISARLDILKNKEALEEELEYIKSQLEPYGACNNTVGYINLGTYILGVTYFFVGAKRSYAKYRHAKAMRSEFYKYYSTRPNLREHSWLFRSMTEDVKLFHTASKFKLYTGMTLQGIAVATFFGFQFLPDEKFKVMCDTAATLVSGSENIIKDMEEVEESIRQRIEVGN